MRIEALAGRTWLLGVVALWALCTWLLALGGLGGQVAHLPEDPSLAQPLPSATIAQVARPDALSAYGQIADRPLFAEDRRPHPFFIDPQEEGEGPADFDVVLTSVLITPGLEMAIVQPRNGGEPLRVRVGDAPAGVANWRLESVEPRSAVFSGPEGERRLELRIFDGSGGIPPTPVAQGADAPEPSPAEAPGAAATPAPPARRGAGARPQPADPAAREAAPGRSSGGTAGAPKVEQDITPAAQAEAIRKRIEARRARLRQSADGQENP